MVFIREMKAKKKNSIFPYRKHIPIVQNHHAKNSHNAQQKKCPSTDNGHYALLSTN